MIVDRLTPAEALHILRSSLRALLRECTYLPDPAARTYWHTRIINRYREFFPRKTRVPWWERPADFKIKSKRNLARNIGISALQKQGRSVLSVLARANAGHAGALEKVLAHTYGRTGKRRHELIAAISNQDVPADHDSVKTLAAALAERGVRQKATHLPATLRAIMKAQRMQIEAKLSRTPLKLLEPDIPVENAWGRPMPLNRLHNLENKWRARALNSILPPLPQSEWERLRDLASGKMEWSGPPPRRGEFLRAPERLNGSNPHRLTPRHMRRMWGKIFVQCPVMHWDPKFRRWAVQWGNVRQNTIPITEQGPNSGDHFFFDGVNEDGEVLETDQNVQQLASVSAESYVELN